MPRCAILRVYAPHALPHPTSSNSYRAIHSRFVKSAIPSPACGARGGFVHRSPSIKHRFFFSASCLSRPSVFFQYAPTNLITTSITGAVSLSWTAPASSGTSGITSYKIYRDTTPGATTLLYNQTSTTSATYTDGSAVHGIAYYYRVTAVNAAGESDYSNQRASGSNSGRIIRLKGAVRMLGGVRLR